MLNRYERSDKKHTKAMTKALSMILVIAMTLSMVMIPCSSRQVEAASVKLNKKTASLTVGESVTLKVTGTKKKVTWTSSKKSIATVTKKGKVTAKKKGTATITAKVAGKKLTCKVTVKKASGKYTNLYDNNNKTKKGAEKLYISKGKSYQVAFYDAKGKKQKTTYKSLDESIATVNAAGLVTGISTGQTIILAATKDQTYEINTTIEKPAAYDFTGVVQTDWHKDWIKGVNFDQIDQKDGSSFTCKMLNTNQKVDWKAKVIYSSKPSHPVKYAYEIIKGCKKDGSLSTTGTTNKITFNGNGSQYITVKVTATLSDGQKLLYYIFYNDKDGNSVAGPRWNTYITLEEFQKNTYDAFRKTYPNAICIMESDIVDYEYGGLDTDYIKGGFSKYEAFHRYDKSEVPWKTIPKAVMPDGRNLFMRIDGADYLTTSVVAWITDVKERFNYDNASTDPRVLSQVKNGKIPVLYVTLYPEDLIDKHYSIEDRLMKTDDDEGFLFFDGTFFYNCYGMQIASVYYSIGGVEK